MYLRGHYYLIEMKSLTIGILMILSSSPFGVKALTDHVPLDTITISPEVHSDVQYLYVHFLYGSKPSAKYRFIEPTWFGGRIGGHVGVGLDSNRILNFVHSGSFHLVTNKRHKHSHYIISSRDKFNCILGGNCKKVKTVTILIPVKPSQVQKLDSISKAYISESPYDYALLGMRCGAASYDLLAQLGILPQYSYRKTSLKILYPKLLRKQLLEKAISYGWPVIRQEGTDHRIWEKD